MKQKHISLKDLVIKENQEEEKDETLPVEKIKEITLDLKEADDDDSLTRIINMRISSTQLKRLRNKAADDNTTVSDYVRGKLFK
jgi:hypothetical protein